MSLKKAKTKTDDPAAAKAVKPSAPARNSNIELLRILAMLGIIAFHMSVYADIPDRGGFFAVYTTNGGWVRFLNTLGYFGNFIFMMISGYFLVNKKFKGVSVVRIILQMWFYSFLVMYILIAAGVPVREAVFDSNLLFPLYHGNNWYIVNYLIVYGLSDLLNAALKHTPKKTMRAILIFALLVQFDFRVFFIHHMPVGKNVDTGRLTCFILLYLVGGYIKLHADDIKCCGKLWINLPLIPFLLWKASHNIIFIDDIMYDFRVLLAAMLMFMSFKKIDIGSKKIINLIGSTTLGIYLLHENPMMYELIWIYVLKVGDHARDSWFILYTVFCTVSVFIVCMLLDLVRIRYFAGPLRRFADNTLSVFFSKMKTTVKTTIKSQKDKRNREKA